MAKKRHTLKANGRTYTMAQLIEELDREIAMRRKKYPEWAENFMMVARGEWPEGKRMFGAKLDPEVAADQLERLMVTRELLIQLCVSLKFDKRAEGDTAHAVEAFDERLAEAALSPGETLAE